MATNRYNAESSFIPAEPQQAPALPVATQPDLLSSKQAAEIALRLIDTYTGQQKAAQSAVGALQGEIVGGRDRGISTSAEIAERRRTTRQYLLALVTGYGMAVAGAEIPVALAIVKGAGVQTPWLLWPGLWSLFTGCAVAYTILKLERSDRAHTPEGLARQRESHEHEVRLLQAQAEARRFDAGTELLREQARRAALENVHLEQQLSTVTKIEPQSHSNMLASYVPEPETLLAEAEAFKRKLLEYLTNPANRDDTGRFHGQVPWSARGAFTKPESERAKHFFADAERYAGHWLVKYDAELRAWRLNTGQLPNARAVLAAFADVELRK